jgi:hypothetical protein
LIFNKFNAATEMTEKNTFKEQLTLVVKTIDQEAPIKRVSNKNFSSLSDSSTNSPSDQKIFEQWKIVHDLLKDPFFENLYSELVPPKISSTRYSLVLAVLSYPQIASTGITQDELDKAHRIAKFIQRNVRSGRLTYTNAKVPTHWQISGNPGTKR